MKTTTALAAAALVFSVSAASATEFVTNGGFESSSYASNTQFGSTYNDGLGVTGWMASTAPNNLEFYFIGGTQTTVNATNQYGDPQGYFHPSFTTLSPTGGNFVALDGDSDYHGVISQNISGLTVGQTYTLSFDWLASQLLNRDGDTTEQLTYSLGTDKGATAVVKNPDAGTTAWMHVTQTFIAQQTAEVLTFTSVGTPQGLPPIAALDSVSLTGGVPEPASWAMMIVGVIGMGGMMRRRRALAVA